MSCVRVTPLENVNGAFIVKGMRHGDQRGFFEEIYNESKLAPVVSVFKTSAWQQVSLASSQPNVLRGLHCSNYAKYVQCVRGRVFDVVVDLRPESSTYLKWQGVWLDGNDEPEPVHLFVPKRCGHGYFSQVDSLFLYLQDGVYNPSEDIEINPFDSTIKVEWPKPESGDYIISDKDKKSPFVKDVPSLLKHQKLPDQYREIISTEDKTNTIKLLIYGTSGFLGGYFTELVKSLEQTGSKISFVSGTASLEDRRELLEEIRRVKPDRVVCLAGLAGSPDITWCDRNQIETIRVNLVGQFNVADAASEYKNNLHCTLITSGGIYTYDESHSIGSGKAYSETDEPTYVNKLFYYDTRIQLEQLLKFFPNVLNLRVMYPTIGDIENKRGLIGKLIGYPKIQSVPISVTVLDDLWPIMLDMVCKSVCGTFNFNNPGTITHEQILNMYKELVNPSHTWELMPYSATRPAAELSAQKLLDLGYKVPNVQDSFRKIFQNYAEQKTGHPNFDLSFLSSNLGSPNFTNIMITGGAGFIASHVAILLCKRYKRRYNIIVYDILDYCSNIKNLDEIKNEPNFKFIKGNICDFDMVKFVMEEFKIDCVMHFAAQSHVDLSMKNSLAFTEANVKGTHVLLEAARQVGACKRFVHVSTDEVYGTTDEVANINQALEPTNPYACSKLAAECIIKAYQKCFKMPILISRCNNVYGPHQFLEKVIPKFITRLAKDLKCCIHDDGSSERDFLYASDVAEAFDLLLHKGTPGHFYNIGASRGITIKEVAHKLINIMKNKKSDPAFNVNDYIEHVPGRILDDQRYKIDATKIKELGWRQKVDFDEGLTKTVEWYTSHLDYWNNSDYALAPHPPTQIQE